MKVSVITIVYNDVSNIGRTLQSVINQTHRNIEYIVVDGASTDGTSEIIRRYTDHIDKYICEPDTGIYNAMNKGLREATGDYVIFINCGDRFSANDTVAKIIAAIGMETPDVVYGNYREFNSNSNETSQVISCRSANKIWYGPVASHQSTLYRLKHLQNHGLSYDESYKIAADYKLTAQAIVAAKSTLKTDICVSDFDTSGISSNNQNLGLKEANRVRREVMGWSVARIMLLTAILLCARFTKKYLNPIYKLLRN